MNDKKILVINPSSKVTRNIVRDVIYGCWCKGKRIGGGGVPPHSLLEVASYLISAGFSVDFIDAQGQNLSWQDINISNYSVVIISTSTMSFTEDTEFLTFLKKQNPELKTIIFGSHPSFMPEYSLEKESVDFIIIREPEAAISALLKKFFSGGEYQNISGIGFKISGKKIINDGRTFIEELDSLPFVEYDLLPKNVRYFNPLIKREPYMTMITSRGCVGRCTFCTAPGFYGSKLRFQSAQRVLAEIKNLVSKGIKEIYFRDETFIVDQTRDRELCETLIKEKIDVTWICNCRIGMVKKDMLKLMKEAGCHYIKTGLESGDDEILRNVKKGITTSQTLQFFEWTKEIGIDTHSHCMVGMPGDSVETINKTINFVLRCNPTTATFGICSPYPGSQLFKLVEQKFPEIKDGSSTDLTVLHTRGLFNDLYCSVDNEKLPALVKKAYFKFYMRPSYFFKTLKRIKNAEDFKRFWRAGRNIIDFSIRGE